MLDQVYIRRVHQRKVTNNSPLNTLQQQPQIYTELSIIKFYT